jgi:diguanylate cyclase (GGDEF)-like protein
MDGLSQHIVNLSSLEDIVEGCGWVGYDWNLATDHLEWFGNWQKIFGALASPPSNAAALSAVIMPEDRSLIFSGNETKFEREYRVLLPDGPMVWVHETGQTFYRDDRPVRQQGLVRVVAMPQRAQANTGENQTYDLLTNRPNRQFLLAQLTRLAHDTGELKQNHAILTIGVDKMAFVNAAVGTKAGDALLRGVAERLSQLSPSGAMVARVGGDTFGILLMGRGSEAKALATKILISFRDAPIVTVAGPLHVSVSIGGIQLCGGDKSADELLINAEQALHEARTRGRNQYVEFEDSQKRSDEQRTRLEMAERINKALKQHALRLAFQPIVSGENGQPVAYEALVRMFDDEGKMIPAAHFIPLVEELGLVLTLDRQVLNLAVKELELAPQLRLAINVSAITAAQADWPAYMETVLGGRPDIAKRLIVEITETAAIMDVDAARSFIEALKKLGGRAALDDFGAGFTSIRHLHDLSFDYMKIDRELLLNLIGNKDQEHLVRTLIYLAKGLGLVTIAEGIENQEIADWLSREKVELLQGYHFGKPSLERPWLGEAATNNLIPFVKPATRQIAAS